MFEDFKLFFQNYKSLYNQVIQNDLSNYSSIFKEVRTITEKGLVEEEEKTTTYNIFNILKIEKNEDETHTPFLKDLLDIRGTHCQKDLFYNLFLEQIIPVYDERSKFLPDNPVYYNIVSQKGIYNYHYGQGFLDIFIDYIEPGRKSFSIVIENKIFHIDEDDQLNKYDSYLEYLYRDNKLLVYLTLWGTPPEENSMKHEKVKELIGKGRLKLVSYQDHLKSVLNDSLNPQKKKYIKSEKLKNTILQYKTLIESLIHF
jgi:hypothetical protein